jgi:cell division protease FtsH
MQDLGKVILSWKTEGQLDEFKAAIEAHREQLVAIAEALLIRETLDGNDVAILMKGGTLPPPKAGNTPSAPAIPDEAAALDPGLNPALKPA